MSGLEHQLAELGGDIAEVLEDVRLPAWLLGRDGVVRWQNRASIESTGSVAGPVLPT